MVIIDRILSPEPIAAWTQETLNSTYRKLSILQRISSCWNILTGSFCYLTGFNACRFVLGALSQMHVPTFIMPLSLSVTALAGSLAVALLMKRITEKHSPEALGCTKEKQKLFANKGCEALTEELSRLTLDQASLKRLCEKVNRKSPGAVRFDPKTSHLQTYLGGVDFDKIIRLLNKSRAADVLIEFVDLKDICTAHTISLLFANESVDTSSQVDRVNMQLKALFCRVECEGAKTLRFTWNFFPQVCPTVYLWENRSVVVDPPASLENAAIDPRYNTVAKIIRGKVSYEGLDYLDSEKTPSFRRFVREFRVGLLRDVE